MNTLIKMLHRVVLAAVLLYTTVCVLTQHSFALLSPQVWGRMMWPVHFDNQSEQGCI